jgi:hypothetical protein
MRSTEESWGELSDEMFLFFSSAVPISSRCLVECAY